MSQFKNREYPRPAVTPADPDLDALSAAFTAIDAECERILAGSRTSIDKDHARFIQGKADWVRRLIRNRIRQENEEKQLRMFQ